MNDECQENDRGATARERVTESSGERFIMKLIVRGEA
jgi:hypothetical protein